MDDDDAAVVPLAKAAEGYAAAIPDANSFAAVNALTYGVSDTRLDLDAGHNATAKASCIERILADPSINDDQKERKIATLYQCWGWMTTMLLLSHLQKQLKVMLLPNLMQTPLLLSMH